ncbi:hypothetical protein E3E26_09780 [Thermococcus sp. LS1]|uniref:hypothetical protein n=1 Tax=Thermococcus sp. LS1 TaxID=1638259 RepID=UPI00143A997A|nr:hypothetical protein [Thermococcus sp. LS1]NJE00061.1 hypothetical protein [Thermococcus sp. LS1]
MKRSPFHVLLTFFEDVFLVSLLGIAASAVIYFSVSWLEIGNEYWGTMSSLIIAVLGVSIFRRGTLLALNQKLPGITVYVLVAITPVMFTLGYWPVGSLLLGFLGGYAEKQKIAKTQEVHRGK